MDATAHSFRNSVIFIFRKRIILQVAYFLRRQPYQVNFVFGGVDDDVPSIYYIDDLGVMQKMNYASHGYGSYILLSLFDRLWKVSSIFILLGIREYDKRRSS